MRKDLEKWIPRLINNPMVNDELESDEVGKKIIGKFVELQDSINIKNRAVVKRVESAQVVSEQVMNEMRVIAQNKKASKTTLWRN